MDLRTSSSVGSLAYRNGGEGRENDLATVSIARFSPPSMSGPPLRSEGFEASAKLREHYNSLAKVKDMKQGSATTSTQASYTLSSGSPSPVSQQEPLTSVTAECPRTWHKSVVTYHTHVWVAVGEDRQDELPLTFDVVIEEKSRIVQRRGKAPATYESVTFSLPNVQSDVWQPDREALNQYLKDTFNLDGHFMKRIDIWSDRSRSCKHELAQKMKTLVRVAYKQYLEDVVERK
jgi:hypothetical protein